MIKKITGFILILIFPKIVSALGFSGEYRENIHFIDLSSLNRYTVSRGYSSFDFKSTKNNSKSIALLLLTEKKLSFGLFVDRFSKQVEKEMTPYISSTGEIFKRRGTDLITANIHWVSFFIGKRLKNIKLFEITTNIGGGFGISNMWLSEWVINESGSSVSQYNMKTNFKTSAYLVHVGINFKYKFFRWGKVGIGLKYNYVPNGDWRASYDYNPDYSSNYFVQKPEKINLSKFSIHAGIEFGGGPSF